MDKQAKIAIEVEMLQVENAIKSTKSNLDTLLFANNMAKFNKQPLPYSASLIKWYQDKMMELNGSLVELTLKLASL